jgi:hypothetical protein
VPAASPGSPTSPARFQPQSFRLSRGKPGQIAWTIEVESLGPTSARLATETRAVATDEESRRRFRLYWRWARFGIVAIRWFMLPAIRRQAERDWRRNAPQ